MGQLKPDIIIRGKYKIIEVLKSGTYSTTCIASDKKGNTCILKEFLSSSSDKYEDEERSKQFSSYIISIKQREHPFLARLLDAFQDNNKYYIVMEYIEGRSLDDFIKKEKLPLNEIDVLNIGKKITELISYMHSHTSKDFIMISLAPSHIILDKRNNPRFINFRFDKILLDCSTKEFNGYISPEEYSGISENTLSSDIYSMGVMLHQFLTGRDPAISPFKFCSVQKINPSVTAKTSSFISKATEYNPSVRYRNVTELKEALNMCMKEAEEYAKSVPSLSLLIKNQSNSNIYTGIIGIMVAVIGLFVAIYFVSFITDLFKKNKKIDSEYNLKTEGINCYNAGKYNIAFDHLTEYLSTKPYDGEAMIYKENSYLNIKNNRAIDIAVTGSLSGSYADFGTSMLQGVALAQKIINSEQRIPGYFMRIILQDDKGESSRANDIATEIAGMNSILGVISSIQDNSTVGPVYNEGGIPQIIPFSLKNNYTCGGYCISNSEPLQAKILAKYSIVDMDCKRIVLIYDDTGYEFINLYKSETRGGEILKTIAFNHKNTDIALEISNLNSDLIVISGDIENVKLICNILQKNHISTRCLIAGSQVFLINPGEETLQGIIFATLFNAGTNDINAQKFIKLFTDNFGGTIPNQLNALSYDATLLMAKAISEGGRKREDIKNYLSSIGGKNPPFIGVTGVTAFDKTGSVQKDMLLINIKNHMFQPVGVISM